MRIRNSRPPFPIPYLHAQQNASISSQDHSKRAKDSGPVMKDPESPDQLQPGEAKPISGSSFAPEMLKPVFPRRKGTGNRGRSANKAGINTRKRDEPEIRTSIVLALRACLPSDRKNPTPVRKNRRKEDKNEAAETRLVSAVSPKKIPSGPEVKEGTKSINCVWRSEPSPPLSPPKEDQQLFLEAVDALRRVKPKRGRGRPKKIPTDQPMVGFN